MSEIVYLEIPAPDLSKAKTFFGDVFGWTFTDSGEHYAMFSTGGEGGMGGGGLDAKQEASEKGLNLYIRVDDIPAALARIAEHGGSVVAEKTKISDEHGYFGLFKDPNGNRLGIWSRT